VDGFKTWFMYPSLHTPERYNTDMPKVRLDVLLLEQHLAGSRTKAQALIMAGQVRVDGQVTLKPATAVPPTSKVTVDSGPRFVSRGGEKLDAALETFGMDVTGLVCADVGASTGGFTDCLLQRGATRIYTIDVGKGLLDWKLRNDPRVFVMERANARFIEELPEQVDVVTVDASFISLKLLLPVIKNWLSPAQKPPVSKKFGKEKGEGGIVALIKPQFEAGRKEVSRGSGVIRDAQIHKQVLLDVLGFAEQQGFGVNGLTRSPIQGPKGNVEFLVWLVTQAGREHADILVEREIPEDKVDELS
jgi:23S rRNA (cytidine1920-2'-O)/16S rRNA (cytidine1409-2'-O)-methyltransferase